MLDRSSHAFSERLFGYEGAAWGPRYTTENFLQRLRGNAASAIAAPAKIWFVRKADIGVHCSERSLYSLSFESELYGPHAYHGDDIAF